MTVRIYPLTSSERIHCVALMTVV